MQKMNADKNTFECFCLISCTEDEFYRSYLKRDGHWFKVEGLRAKKVGVNFMESFTQNEEKIMY